MTIRVYNLGFENSFFCLSKYIGLLLVLICLSGELHSQIQYTTLSGQVLEQVENGDYIVVLPQMPAVDTIDAVMLSDTSYKDLGMEMLVIDQNPITNKNNKQNELTDYESQLRINMENKAMANEVSEWKLSQQITKQISAYEINLSQAKLTDNANDQNEAVSKLNELKGKLKANQKRSEKTYKQIVEIRSLSALNTKKRNHKLKVLGVELEMPVNNDKLTPSPEIKEQDKKFAHLRSQNCTVSVYNKKNKTYRIGYQPLVNYTPEKFKSHLKTNDLLQASISLGKERNNYTLYLDLSLQSKEVAKSYGVILPGYQVVITFINGQKLSALCSSSPTPTIEPYTARSLYKARYKLSADDMKKMKKIPIDKFTIQFASGHETYTIYEVDVLMNQADCLAKL